MAGPAQGGFNRNYNIFNGGKIRVDLTNTKYKLMRECALEMKWKVITAKKKEPTDDSTATTKTGEKAATKKETKEARQNEITLAEQIKKEEINRHANVDIIWNDVTILSEKLSQLKAFQKVNHFPAMCGVTRKS